MNDINLAVEAAIKFYKDNNYSIPNSVTEYIGNYPKGLSRQVLSTKYNIKCSEFVKMLNPNYEKPLSATDRVQVEASRLGYEILSDVHKLTSNRDKVSLKCRDCGNIHETTITSLSGSKLGCLKCKSGNLPWYKREQELKNLLHLEFDAELVSSIPDNQTGYITVKHSCGQEYTTQLLGIVSPTTKLRGTCPNCRNSDRRVVFNNITFGSEFELNCYKLLSKFNPELHVKYNKYFATERRWVCDFKINNFWIEVSNFKQDYKNYFQNIEDKQSLVESNGHYFFFIRSIKELEEIISLM